MNTRYTQLLIQLSLVLVMIAPFLGFALFITSDPPLVDMAAESHGGSNGGGLHVSWLGAGSVYISDGETSLITDPFFSRPSLGQLLFNGLEPDPGRIRDGLTAAGIRKLSAVIPLHSHYDHLLDGPFLASRFDALLIGSRSSANVARGAGLTEALIREVKPGDQLQLGDFRLTFVRSAHAPMAPVLEKLTGRGEDIDYPFSTPAYFTAWHEGEVTSLIVRHPRGSLLISGTAGFQPGALAGQEDVDLALVSVGLLSRQSAEYQEEWFHETVAVAGPDRVIPIHWDDHFAPLTPDTPPMPYFFDNAGASLDALEHAGRKAGITVEHLRPLGSVALNTHSSPPMSSSQPHERALQE